MPLKMPLILPPILSQILFGMTFLSLMAGMIGMAGCGNGFSVATHVVNSYDGSPADYCSLPANFAGLPSQESIASFDQLPTLRLTAATLVAQNALQEAIWLFQLDPTASATVISLKQQLAATLFSNNFQIQDSTLGGFFEKYVLTFSNGVKAIFKPTDSVYSETIPYRFDELLEFGLVPMTIDRTVNGRRGTVQYFVNGMSAAAVNQIASKNFRKMIVFDFLIRNRDRDLSNFLYWPTQNQVVAIDNGASFVGACGIPDEIKKHLEIEKSLSQRLANLTENTLNNALADVPSSYKKIIWRQLSRIK